MKKELIQSIEREKKITLVAMNHIEDRLQVYEKKYGWQTRDFIAKFETGIAGDDDDFFKWYALAEALNDWSKTRKALEEVLAN